MLSSKSSLLTSPTSTPKRKKKNASIFKYKKHAQNFQSNKNKNI